MIFYNTMHLPSVTAKSMSYAQVILHSVAPPALPLRAFVIYILILKWLLPFTEVK